MMSEKQQGSSTPEPSLQTVEMVCDRLAELGVAVGPDTGAGAGARGARGRGAPGGCAAARRALHRAPDHPGRGAVGHGDAGDHGLGSAGGAPGTAARLPPPAGPAAAPAAPAPGRRRAAAAGAEAGAAAVGAAASPDRGRRGRAPSGVPASRSALVLLHRVWEPKLAQASYLLGCIEAREALVIDANRDVDQYLALAASLNLRIAHVTETHIHADYRLRQPRAGGAIGREALPVGRGRPRLALRLRRRRRRGAIARRRSALRSDGSASPPSTRRATRRST